MKVGPHEILEWRFTTVVPLEESTSPQLQKAPNHATPSRGETGSQLFHSGSQGDIGQTTNSAATCRDIRAHADELDMGIMLGACGHFELWMGHDGSRIWR